MLKISQDQMRSYRDERVSDSRARLTAELRKRLPRETARFSDSDMSRLCDLGLDRARAYGIGTEYNVYRFLCCMLLYRGNFDTDPNLPWTREILDDKAMDQDHKARLLEMRIAQDFGRGI
jgi:hypothetical protein